MPRSCASTRRSPGTRVHSTTVAATNRWSRESGSACLSNALQILLPASGALLLFWGWVRNRVLIRRELRFDRFIALVSGVERRALELELGASHDRQAIRRLHQELCTIKDAALERVAVGEGSDSALVTSLFSHIGDVREFLAHLERTCNHLDDAKNRIGSGPGSGRQTESPGHAGA